MARSVTTLGVEGAFLRAVRLEEKDGTFVRTVTDCWPLEGAPAETPEEGAQAEAPEGEAAAEDDAAAQGPSALARAFASAAKKFGTKEFSVVLPLSRFLVKCFRMQVAESDLMMDKAVEAVEAISPFPDEELSVTAEVWSETETELVVMAAALPASAAAETGEALLEAGVRVTRTDIAALGRLRVLWERLGAGVPGVRLVLGFFGGEWELVVLVDGAPVFLRGIGRMERPEELGREVTLSLLQCADAAGAPEEVLVASDVEIDAAFVERLSAFAPVRTVSADDPYVVVEGCARREAEGCGFDATPADWAENLAESRFMRRLKTAAIAAAAVWLLAVGTMFGVETAFDMMKDRQQELRKERVHQRAYREVTDMKNRIELIGRYADHAHCALEALKTVSDCLPDSDDMTFRTFRYVRGESVRVQGSARAREDLRTFIENLETAVEGEDETKVFGEVKQTGGETETKNGLRFSVDAFFPKQDEDGGSGK